MEIAFEPLAVAGPRRLSLHQWIARQHLVRLAEPGIVVGIGERQGVELGTQIGAVPVIEHRQVGHVASDEVALPIEAGAAFFRQRDGERDVEPSGAAQLIGIGDTGDLRVTPHPGDGEFGSIGVEVVARVDGEELTQTVRNLVVVGLVTARIGDGNGYGFHRQTEEAKVGAIRLRTRRLGPYANDQGDRHECPKDCTVQGDDSNCDERRLSPFLRYLLHSAPPITEREYRRAMRNPKQIYRPQ